MVFLKMNKAVIVCIILFWVINFGSLAQGQHTSGEIPIITELQQKDSVGFVQIIQDKRIDSLLFKYLNTNKRKQTVPGFRIRIFEANNQEHGRQRATDEMAKFLNKFSGLGEEVYRVYESPEWKVYIGDLRTRSDAFKIKKQIESVFTNNRIVESEIDYTKL
jgi:hypothetical protein